MARWIRSCRAEGCVQMSKEQMKGSQPKAKSESSDIQEKKASVKIAGAKTGKDKPKQAPLKEP